MALSLGFKIETLIEENRITETEIKILKSWLDENGYKNLTLEQVAQFLLACDNDFEFTKITIKEYFKHRNSIPEIFNNMFISEEGVQNIIKLVKYCIIPKRTKDDNLVVLYKLKESNANLFDFGASIKVMTMMLDTALYDYPPRGVLILIDLEEMTLNHMTKLKMGLCRRSFHYLQDGFPAKLKAIHIINMVTLVDKLFSLVKSLMKEGLAKKVTMHPKSMDKNTFFETCIERDCLPEDYGGTLPSVDILHQKTIELINLRRPFFEEERYQRSLIAETPKHIKN